MDEDYPEVPGAVEIDGYKYPPPSGWGPRIVEHHMPPGGAARLYLSTSSALHDRAQKFFAGLDDRARRQSFWPAAPESRQAYALELLARSRFTGIIAQRIDPQGDVDMCVGLACPCCEGSATAIIHFIGRPQAHAAGFQAACRKFINFALVDWPVLTCALPRHWHGSRALARSMGFRELATFPKAGMVPMAQGHGETRRLSDVVFLMAARPEA